MTNTLKRYLVEWSAPDYKNAKSLTTRAYSKHGAIGNVKKKLGKKVKEQHLHHFYAIRMY